MFLKHVLEEFSGFLYALLAQLQLELVDRVLRSDVWPTVAHTEILVVWSVVLVTVSTHALATKIARPRKCAAVLAAASMLTFVVTEFALV